jgi:salicylate hydroxylase
MMRHAVIAGAGIGGLSAALCLAEAGFRVSLYDKAKVLDETGAGLQLSPNASAILQRLGVTAHLKRSALHPKAIRLRRARDGATLALLPLGDAEQRFGAPYLVAHRGDLQRALLEAAAREPRISVQTGAAVTGFASGLSSVSVVIEQGDCRLKAEGDCLIGADGLRSAVARELGAGEASFSGKTAWRGVVDCARAPAAARQEESNLWLGQKAHLVHYPLRGGAIINVVAIVEEEFRGEEDFWSSPGEAEFLDSRFSGWDEAARELLRAVPNWRKWPLYDRAPLARWCAGRVALVGDAAHPMLPFLAQGAAQAIEDAAMLGEALAGAQDIAVSLCTYQEARRARAARVQRESRRQALIYHLAGPAAALRDAGLRALGGKRLLARYDWLYDARGGSAARA